MVKSSDADYEYGTFSNTSSLYETIESHTREIRMIHWTLFFYNITLVLMGICIAMFYVNNARRGPCNVPA